MTWYPTGKRELKEEPLEALQVLADVWVHLRIGPFQVGIRHDAGAPVSRPDHVHQVETTSLYDPVEVGVDEIEPWSGTEVAEKTGLDVFGSERLGEERVVHQVDLAD